MPAATDSLSPIRSLLTEIGSAILHAQASIEHDQSVELSLLERQMGLLCAKALDLPDPLRQQARTELASLRQPINHLIETLIQRVGS
jgi:hypothetical protein